MILVKNTENNVPTIADNEVTCISKEFVILGVERLKNTDAFRASHECDRKRYTDF